MLKDGRELKASRKARKKRGRLTIYSSELAARICAELACGKSLRTVCMANDMAGLEIVFRWLREKPEFRDQYEHAENESADALIEEMLDIADDGSNDWIEVRDKDGESVGWKSNGENVQRSRLGVDVRKWAASKLKPKKYGERVDMNHGVQPDDPLAALIRSIQGSSFRPVAQLSLDDDDDELPKLCSGLLIAANPNPMARLPENVACLVTIDSRRDSGRVCRASPTAPR